MQALQDAGLEKGSNPDGHGALDKTRVGVLVGSGMGGLTGEHDRVGRQSACMQQRLEDLQEGPLPASTAGGALECVLHATPGWLARNWAAKQSLG